MLVVILQLQVKHRMESLPTEDRHSYHCVCHATNLRGVIVTLMSAYCMYICIYILCYLLEFIFFPLELLPDVEIELCRFVVAKLFLCVSVYSTQMVQVTPLRRTLISVL